MNNIVNIAFRKKDDIDGQRQMFAFAADDYNETTGKIAKTAIGAILEENDTHEDLTSFLELLQMHDLIIFDINHVSDKKVTWIREYFEALMPTYKEIFNVYDDRIVFGKI